MILRRRRRLFSHEDGAPGPVTLRDRADAREHLQHEADVLARSLSRTSLTGPHPQVMRGVFVLVAGKRLIGVDVAEDSNAVVKVSVTSSGGP